MYVLDHTNDEDKDDWKITFVPLMCKIKVEPRIQGTSLEAAVPLGVTSPEAAVPPSAAEVGSVPTAIPPAFPPSADVPPTVHGTVPLTAAVPVAASLPVGEREEDSDNVGFLANQEDEEEEESYGDDGEIAEVAGEAVRAEEIF